MVINLSREQVRLVDRLAIDRYAIPSIVLMENAGRHAAQQIQETYDRTPAFILCGTGNNGGDGCVIARHLHNAGWDVCLRVAGDRHRMTSDTATNLAIAEKMTLDSGVAAQTDVSALMPSLLKDNVIVVDALLGTGFKGDVRDDTAELIEAVNRAEKRAVVAIDVPSGLDCDTGRPSNATIRADLTITFVANKIGFLRPAAAEYVGRVRISDIGAPRELIQEVASLDPNP